MTPGFASFGIPHLTAIGLTVALAAALTFLVRRGFRFVRYAVAGLLLLNEFTWWTIRIHELGLGGFLRNHLPLHLCGVAVFLTVATLVFRSPHAYQIAWYWGMVGALNAIVTPGNLEAGFPAYRFFQYFLAHGGIVIGVAVATWGFGMCPTLRGLFTAFVCLNLLALVVAPVNLLLGANYMYLSAPPGGTASPFFFAPWPWYLLFLEFLGLAMFFLAYLPFAARRS